MEEKKKRRPSKINKFHERPINRKIEEEQKHNLPVYVEGVTLGGVELTEEEFKAAITCNYITFTTRNPHVTVSKRGLTEFQRYHLNDKRRQTTADMINEDFPLEGMDATKVVDWTFIRTHFEAKGSAKFIKTLYNWSDAVADTICLTCKGMTLVEYQRICQAWMRSKIHRTAAELAVSGDFRSINLLLDTWYSKDEDEEDGQKDNKIEFIEIT